MTYRVEATATALGWTLTVTGAAGRAAAARQLQRTAGADAYPLPDRAEAARWAGQPHAIYCDDADGAAIGVALRRILRNESSARESEAFGRYLLDTLLGPEWDAIEAATPAGDPIEIEISVAPEDAALLRLPWEMMHDAGGALAARTARKVVFTRLIPPVAGRSPGVAAQPVPLRILFVVGRQLDNSLRPGAEFFGLLRHLRVPTNATFKVFTTAAVSVRYLGEATVDELEHAVAEFQPSVVHFTCHGEASAAGVQLLLTAREKENDPAARKTQDPYPIGAGRLLSLLRREGGVLPPVVVVNACHTGDAHDEAMSALSFAAHLVEGDAGGGVAMAIGMTGEVDDRACQAFTLRFYQALVAGAPVAIAAAEGRRGAMLEYPELQDSLEWIRPTFFRAAGAADVLPLQQALLPIATIAAAFRKQATFCDIVCDRYDTLALAQDFLRLGAVPDGQRPLILPFAARHPAGGLGHTRLLEEIAGLAVYAGYLPCLLRSSETSEPAANLLELVLAITDALRESIDAFRIVAPNKA
ncbi:MAG TPA: CHAT domain-containing protein, partial [Vicinamibacterales bacterium]|nr:CHAT domain-containing protein [Vicinamibacterales bacterium]